MRTSSFRYGLFLGVWLLSAVAAAQSVTLSLDGGSKEKVVGRSDCSKAFLLGWEFTISSSYSEACEDLQIFVSSSKEAGSGCEGGKEIGRVSTQDLMNVGSRFVELTNFGSWPGFNKDDTICGGSAETVVTHHVCGVYSVRNINNSECEKKTATTLSVIYKTTKPKTPTLESAEGYDGEAMLRYSVSSGDYVSKVVLYGKRKSVPTPEEEMGTKAVSSSIDTFRISGLENDIYTFRLKAIDEVGNESELSDSMEVDIRRTYGFWDLYKEQGGGGGCHSAGGGLLAGLGLAFLGFYMLRRP
ncbi:MAG: hypothetical protein FWD46_04700 [Cystobacterineae bacterium]|nr:hypothetical protein [Cystobacterineae bacterium]